MAPITYDVFARMRHRRLTLRRGLPTLAHALAFSERLQQRGADAVLEIRDSHGAIVAIHGWRVSSIFDPSSRALAIA